MKRQDVKLAHGGLMRCCVDSFDKWVAQDRGAEVQPGERVPCLHENAYTMQANERGDTVQWAHAQAWRSV